MALEIYYRLSVEMQNEIGFFKLVLSLQFKPSEWWCFIQWAMTPLLGSSLL